jgi:hypothetical protein
MMSQTTRQTQKAMLDDESGIETKAVLNEKSDNEQKIGKGVLAFGEKICKLFPPGSCFHLV